MLNWAGRYGTYRRTAAGWLRGSLIVAGIVGALLIFRYRAAAVTPAPPEEAGILITSVIADTPAARAGIKRGDIVLALDDQAADDVAALHSQVQAKQVGDQVRLKVRHGDEIRTLEIALGERDGNAYLGLVPFIEHPWAAGGATATMSAWTSDATGPLSDGLELAPGHAWFGSAPLTSTLEMWHGPDGSVTIAAPPFSDTLHFTAGMSGLPSATFAFTLPFNELPVGVVEPGSPAAQAGLQPSDTITGVNAKPLASPFDLWAALDAAKPGDTLELTLRDSDNQSRTVTVTLAAHPQQPDAAYLGLADDTHAAPAMALPAEGFAGPGHPPFGPLMDHDDRLMATPTEPFQI